MISAGKGWATRPGSEYYPFRVVRTEFAEAGGIEIRELDRSGNRVASRLATRKEMSSGFRTVGAT